jgi:hypothetical protein
MVSSAVRYAPEDPFCLVESCQRAIEWILRSHAVTGEAIRRAWSEVSYGEEEITRLEEELLPAMAALLERVGEIDRRVEGSQPEAGQPVAASHLLWDCGSRGREALKPSRYAGSPRLAPAARAPSC